MLRKIQLTSIPQNVNEDDNDGSSSLSRSSRRPSATGKEKKTKKSSSSGGGGGMKEKIKMKFQRGFSKASLDKVEVAAAAAATTAVAVETPAKIVAGKYLVYIFEYFCFILTLFLMFRFVFLSSILTSSTSSWSIFTRDVAR